MKLQYVRKGDYLYPNLTIESTETRPIGIWGIKRRDYLKEHRIGTYTKLLFSGTLDSHLADINEEAEYLFDRLTEKMAKAEGITELLKEDNQFLWIVKMNAIRERAAEIVNHELIRI